MPQERSHFEPRNVISQIKEADVRTVFATPIVIYYAASPAGTTPVGRRRIEDIKGLGFQVELCIDVAQLLKMAQSGKSGEARTIFVLTGSVVEICSVAMNLRAHQAPHAIVALMDSASDMALTQVLQSGVDNYCMATSHAGLLAAILLRLQSRFCQASLLGHDESAAPRWRLDEHNWVLVSPEGVRIRLTTNERCFMKILLGSPDLRVTHEQLLAGMGSSHAGVGPQPAPRPGRLGVMVSRLRAKLKGHGVSCPVKSLHNWGYMFTGVV